MHPTSNDVHLFGTHVVLGGTGGVGHALVNELETLGRPLRVVSRTVPTRPTHGTTHLAADLSDATQALRACEGATVVFFAAQPPYDKWAELFPTMTANVINACAVAGAKLVMVDNLYMYGPTTGPLTEQTERKATGRKGTTRIAMEQLLLDAHRLGKARVTIGRLSDYYGANGKSSTVSALVLEPAAAGRAMRWPGSADVAHTLHFLPDIARSLMVLGDDALADGKAWHLPSAPAITGTTFMAAVNATLRAPVKAKTISATSMKIGGLFSKEAKETVECMYQWTAPFVADFSAFTRTFGTTATTPHDMAIAATVASLRSSETTTSVAPR
jgi:nucleoside-diphosphate-sugar epimerase